MALYIEICVRCLSFSLVFLWIRLQISNEWHIRSVFSSIIAFLCFHMLPHMWTSVQTYEFFVFLFGNRPMSSITRYYQGFYFSSLNSSLIHVSWYLHFSSWLTYVLYFYKTFLCLINYFSYLFFLLYFLCIWICFKQFLSCYENLPISTPWIHESQS